jgi:hypothetical protein
MPMPMPIRNLGEVGIDGPVVNLISVAQRGARHLAAQAHVVNLPTHGSKASLDVAQTFPIRQLGERHRQLLVQQENPLKR